MLSQSYVCYKTSNKFWAKTFYWRSKVNASELHIQCSFHGYPYHMADSRVVSPWALSPWNLDPQTLSPKYLKSQGPKVQCL